MNEEVTEEIYADLRWRSAWNNMDPAFVHKSGKRIYFATAIGIVIFDAEKLDDMNSCVMQLRSAANTLENMVVKLKGEDSV